MSIDPICQCDNPLHDHSPDSKPQQRTCGATAYWWSGEYEGDCELTEGHKGDHWDGLSWFNDDNECTDSSHAAPPDTSQEDTDAAMDREGEDE